jgi:hypothetical protein
LKEVVVDEKLTPVVQLAPNGSNNILVTVDRSQIWLGVEPNPQGGMKKLQVFTKDGDKTISIDELYFRSYGRDAFWWSEYAHSRVQTRSQVKARLNELGFDPAIIDRLFPERPQHEKPVTEERMTATTNCGNCGRAFDIITQSEHCPHPILW